MIRYLSGQGKKAAGIVLRDARELALMREAGRIVARVHEAMRRAVRPGVSTAELDAIAEDIIRSHGATPTFLGYRGFPASICTSINDEIVHGIPSPHRFLKEGDIVSIDVGATYRGWVGDSAWTYPVGHIGKEARALLDVTEGALWAGIDQARAGHRLGDISAAIQAYVESRGFAIIREYGGHGVGREMHEPPRIMNYGRPGTGLRLRAGMTFALEPMVAAGHWLTQLDADGWTVRTQDGSLSAHFEHTLAVTDGDPLIMTVL
ncbi:MAG TPA: type I methionyl aminopeptidase [Anaerolineae bacterium]|nr:type I methionyl aminopeptidase [Anaerolineae bacterium]